MRPLSLLEERELKELLAQQYPQANNLTGEDLIKLGLIAVGAWLLFKAR